MKTVYCDITKQDIPASESYKGSDVRNGIFDLIKKEHPEFGSTSFISKDVLNDYRKRYLTGVIQQETGEISQMEKDVVDAIHNNKILSENIEDNLDEKFTFGQRVADKIAAFGGSWTFIIIFFSFLLLWMMVNIFLLSAKPFDPYPFILLNLILSSLAAIQAPIIMMSQNRQGEKDRTRSEHDYKINLKAEIEIRLLHEKIDHLMVHQNHRLLEIQQLQADYLEDILKEVKDVKGETRDPAQAGQAVKP
jgi:uncharacterized membrane protein